MGDFVKEDSLNYEKLTSTTNIIVVNGKEKLVRKTIKEKLLQRKENYLIV